MGWEQVNVWLPGNLYWPEEAAIERQGDQLPRQSLSQDIKEAPIMVHLHHFFHVVGGENVDEVVFEKFTQLDVDAMENAGLRNSRERGKGVRPGLETGNQAPPPRT